MPWGARVMVPLPEPVLATVSVTVATPKAALTLVAPATVTVQRAVPEQPPPLQPVKTLPAAGVALSVTTAPAPKVLEHTLPQSIPAGADATVPAPAPVRATVSGNDWLVSTMRWSGPSLPKPGCSPYS